VRCAPTVKPNADDPDIEDGIYYPSSDGEPMAETEDLARQNEQLESELRRLRARSGGGNGK
jgi:hypothetical protein